MQVQQYRRLPAAREPQAEGTFAVARRAQHVQAVLPNMQLVQLVLLVQLVQPMSLVQLVLLFLMVTHPEVIILALQRAKKIHIGMRLPHAGQKWLSVLFSMCFDDASFQDLSNKREFPKADQWNIQNGSHASAVREESGPRNEQRFHRAHAPHEPSSH